MTAIFREEDLSCEEAEAQEHLMHEVMTLAVHQVLLKLLPTASHAVEEAVGTLSQQLNALMRLISQQQALLAQRLAADAAEATDAQRRDAKRLEEQLNQSLLALVYNLQFQDRNSQMMQCAHTLVQRCIPENSAITFPNTMAARLSAVTLARDLIGSIPLNDARQMMIHAMESLNVLPRRLNPLAEQTNLPVELF